MSSDEFDNWLSLVGRLLGLNERQRKQISEELRDHLESRVSDLVENGMDRQAAMMKAVEEFGDAAVLAKNLQSVSLVNQKRWMMRFMTLATAALFLVAVLTMAMWPENARFGSPSQTVAQEESEDPFGDDDGEDIDPFTGKKIVPQPRKEEAVKPSERTMSNSKVRKLLGQTSFELVYDNELFGMVREQLADTLKINIVVDPNLEGVLDDDTEVSAKLSGVRLSDGLRAILRVVDATYTIKGGMLVIISIDDENEPDFLSRHLIDVREILRLVRVAESDRVGKPIVTSGRSVGGIGGGFGGGGLGGGGGGGGVFCVASQGLGATQARLSNGEIQVGAEESDSGADTSKKIYPILTAENLLIETITRVVSPDEWQSNGGSCDLTCIGGVLVVLSNESLAEEVQDFVTDLEYQMKNRE